MLYTFDSEVWATIQGRTPVLLHLFDGYMDAGSAGHTVAEAILDNLEHEVLVEFDVDQLHDYRSRRPTATFDTNTWVGFKAPTLRLLKVTDLAGEAFLLLHGAEPDSQWMRFGAAVMGLASRLNVNMFVTATGVPIAVPHTRPTLITVHSTDPGLAPHNPIWIDRVEVPAGMSAILEMMAGKEGHLGIGYVAHVPHYLAQTQFYQAARVLLERIGTQTGLQLPLKALDELVSANLATIDNEMMSDAELPQLVSALEDQYERLTHAQTSEAVPTADEIGAAVEAFLAEQSDPEEPGDAPFGR